MKANEQHFLVVLSFFYVAQGGSNLSDLLSTARIETKGVSILQPQSFPIYCFPIIAKEEGVVLISFEQLSLQGIVY